MPCFLAIVALVAPRFAMACIFLFTNWFSQAYQTAIWPVLGFMFLPYTTLAYMIAMLNNNHELTVGWIVLVILSVVSDLGGQGKSAQGARPKANSESAL
jgi:hypothetical protein